MTNDTGQLLPFTYGDAQVRTVVIDGEPWFVLADLCKVLGIANPSNVTARLDPETLNTLRLTEGIRGNPNVTVVSESGMYEVVIRSDKPEAVMFRRWITAEVLPTIRKTGSYGTPAFDPAQLSRADILKMALAAEEEKAVLAATLESAAPAIAYHERHIAESDDVVTVKTWGTQFGLTEPKAYALLVEKGIVYRLSLGERWSRSKGCKVTECEYRPRAGRITFEWFDLRPQHNAPRHHNGQVRQTLYVKQFFADRLADKCDLTRQLHIDGDAA